MAFEPPRISVSVPSPSPPPSASTSAAPSPVRASFHASDMHHRPPPTVRSSSSTAPSTRAPTPRHSPLLPPANPKYPLDKYEGLQQLHQMHQSQHQQQQQQMLLQQQQQQQPTICGMPLKYVSLVTLAVQNAALSIVMHYSRVSIPPSLAYSPASAVLLNEILKGTISFIIALIRSPVLSNPHLHHHHQHPLTRKKTQGGLSLYLSAFSHLCREVFSPDCWKLSIPAILYVVQNSLQFVAIANLPVASFQVTYQMKILTTAAFSVALLRKKLSTTKWLSLFFLAIGVGIVQIQNAATSSPRSLAQPSAVGSAHEFRHVMNPLKGFGAVTAACFTSGLAGVYFEMVLKGSKADLWVRNVQLSLFSLIPALLPILYNTNTSTLPNSQGFIRDLFRHFGAWAWATVGIQVFGGLVTAVVIKYSDNILKGFATSLSIVFSFLASVALFDFRITPSFVIGASTVLGATWMYNQPQSQPQPTPQEMAPRISISKMGMSESESEGGSSSPLLKSKEGLFSIVLNDASPTSSAISSPSHSPYYPGTPAIPNGLPHPHAQGHTSYSENGNDGATGSTSLFGLGVGSFIRRKSGGFGGAGSSRNSSTASLTALLRESVGPVLNSTQSTSSSSTPALSLSSASPNLPSGSSVSLNTLINGAQSKSGSGSGSGTHTPSGSLSKGELGLAESGELLRSGEDIDALFVQYQQMYDGSGSGGMSNGNSRVASRVGSRSGSPTRFR